MSGFKDFVNDIERPSSLLTGERKSFLLSLMALSAYVAQADSRNVAQKCAYVERFITSCYQEDKAQMCRSWLVRIINERVKYSSFQWTEKIAESADYMTHCTLPYDRLKVVSFLVYVAKSDAVVTLHEVNAVRNVASWLGIVQLAMPEIERFSREVAQ